MNFNKVINHSKGLDKHYIELNDPELLQGIKKEFSSSKKEWFIMSVKHVYLYQKEKEKILFPTWYQELCNQRKKELDDFFFKKMKAIISEAELNEEIEIKIKNKIMGICKKNNRAYAVSIIDSLPLHLRLKVYLDLYQAEEDLKMLCYIRSKLATVLAILKNIELAQQLIIFNWALAQEFEGFHLADSSQTLSKVNRYKTEPKSLKGIKIGKETSILAKELIFYYKNLLIEGYTEANSSILDLVTASYVQYPQLKELLLPIKTYLRTKNLDDLIRSIEALKKAFIYENHEVLLIQEHNLEENHLKDQLVIYNELLHLLRMDNELK